MRRKLLLVTLVILCLCFTIPVHAAGKMELAIVWELDCPEDGSKWEVTGTLYRYFFEDDKGRRMSKIDTVDCDLATAKDIETYKPYVWIRGSDEQERKIYFKSAQVKFTLDANNHKDSMEVVACIDETDYYVDYFGQGPGWYTIPYMLREYWYDEETNEYWETMTTNRVPSIEKNPSALTIMENSFIADDSGPFSIKETRSTEEWWEIAVETYVRVIYKNQWTKPENASHLAQLAEKCSGPRSEKIRFWYKYDDRLYRFGVHDYVMANYDALVEKYFGESTDANESTVSTNSKFTDVPANAYYYDAVLWAVDKGITNGTSATTFGPNVTCTRSQVVTFLWRAKGCPEPTSTANPFVDVQKSDYFYKPVLWAVEQGITNGTSATTFSPLDTCTSSQVVTFLWRANGEPAANVTGTEWYAKAVGWANSKQLLGGTAVPFAPDNLAPRADIVTYLYRDLAK